MDETIGDSIQEDSRKHAACQVILKCWRGYRDRRIFLYLRHAVCRAEDSLTHHVLRKISPVEALILRDPTLNARLRFRFGGSAFPPMILYKIFISANVQYVSGATTILPGSKAAIDACEMMGDRQYFDIVLSDVMHSTPLADEKLRESHLPIQDRLKEHGLMDSHPVWLGGRGNGWRVLIDDKYTCNENALRFEVTSDDVQGRGFKIMESILASMEQKVLSERVNAVPDKPLRKQFASKGTLERIHSSQQRAKSLSMRRLYSSHLSISSEFSNAEDDGEYAAEDREAMGTTGGSSRGGGWSERRASRGGRTGNADLSDEELLEGTATDSLLDWAGQLSFDKYHDTWERTAATIAPGGGVDLVPGSPP